MPVLQIGHEGCSLQLTQLKRVRFELELRIVLFPEFFLSCPCFPNQVLHMVSLGIF